MERKIKDKTLSHSVIDIGDKEKPYVTRYVLDLKVTATTTEFRIHAMEGFLNEMNAMRQKLKDAGEDHILAEKLAEYTQRFDTIISCGKEQNKDTRGKIAKKEEKAL